MTQTQTHPQQPTPPPTLPPTMLEAQVSPTTTISLHRTPLPILPTPHSLLIHTSAISTNPKDWKLPASLLKTVPLAPNSGDDFSGTIVSLGSAVTQFHLGQRVAALHELGAPGGAFAEYAVAEDFACIALPEDLPWEEAAGLGMSLYMAAVGLFSGSCLGVRGGVWDVRTTETKEEQTPLVIWGASSGAGAMAVKLAQICGVHPLICVAGRAKGWVEELIERWNGDVVIDYREGEEKVVERIKGALGGRKLRYAFDAVTAQGSYLTLAKVLEPDGKLALVLPGKRHELPKELKVSHVMVGSMWRPLSSRKEGEELGALGMTEGGQDFGRAMSASFAGLLADGRLKAHPYEVIEGGLNGLEPALQALRQGKNSATKYVVRTADTPGL